MATTSIWSVKGWLGKVVTYVENPQKTENPAFYEKRQENEEDIQCLDDVITYAMDEGKTNSTETLEKMHSFVTGINCLPATARDEMTAVKRQYAKEGGVIAYHGYQSFAPGETTPEIAHKIGIKLAQELWGEKYQVVVATHLDKASLHNHFVINTVSFLDGIRYHRTAKDYRQMRSVSDRLCQEHSLSIVQNPASGRSKQYAEWQAEKEDRPTWRGLVQGDVDEAIHAAMTEKQFFDNLKHKGYEIKVGKDISVRPPGKERFVRLGRNFGDEYRIEAIRKRILKQNAPDQFISISPPLNRKVYTIKGSLKKAKKFTGLRALYYHYCYKLGVFPKKKNANNKQLHFLYREDLRKLDDITSEVKLLCTHKIDRVEQLFSYQNEILGRIDRIIEDRKELYRLSRRNVMKENPEKLAALKEKISGYSDELRTLRREVKSYENILARSGEMKKKMKKVREDENRKEKAEDEQLRRRSRTNR